MRGSREGNDRRNNQERQPGGRGRDFRFQKDRPSSGGRGPPPRKAKMPPSPPRGSFSVVATVIIFSEGSILLVKRRASETWDCPYGTVDPDLPMAAAAVRKLFLETSLRATPEMLRFSSLLESVDRARKVHWLYPHFVVKLRGMPRPRLADEEAQWRWFSLADLPAERSPMNRRAVSIAFPKETRERRSGEKQD